MFYPYLWGAICVLGTGLGSRGAAMKEVGTIFALGGLHFIGDGSKQIHQRVDRFSWALQRTKIGGGDRKIVGGQGNRSGEGTSLSRDQKGIEEPVS